MGHEALVASSIGLIKEPNRVNTRTISRPIYALLNGMLTLNRGYFYLEKTDGLQ